MTSNISNSTILKPYDGLNIPFTQDGYLNATVVAAHFGKLPNDYLRLPETKAYINQLRDFLAIDMNQLVISKRGPASNGGGTWLHRKLAIPFARWCDVRFSIWADQQIEMILSGTYQVPQTTIAAQPTMHLALNRALRTIGRHSDAFIRQAAYKEVVQICGLLGLECPPAHLIGKQYDQMQMEV